MMSAIDGALGLVVNAIVLWNTLYMAAALKELSCVGYAVYPEDVARLSPLIHRHLNFQGRHAFVLPEPVAQGQLRPLRDLRLKDRIFECDGCGHVEDRDLHAALNLERYPGLQGNPTPVDIGALASRLVKLRWMKQEFRVLMNTFEHVGKSRIVEGRLPWIYRKATTEPPLCPACPRGASPPAPLTPVNRLISLLSSTAAGLFTVFRRLVALLCGPAAVLLLSLTVLAILPMPAASHRVGDTDHGPNCVYDFCHSPEFTVGPLVFDMPENTGPNQDVGPLPAATDADHEYPGSPYSTMVYTLRDGNALVEDKDDDEPEDSDGDAANFSIYASGGQRRLRTNAALTASEYTLKLVACDGNFRRGYVLITVRVGSGEQRPKPPDAPMVQGVSTTSLLVNWTAPDNAGRPNIQHYDLQYRQGTSGAWSDGPQDQTNLSATILNLMENTQYQVQVQATNSAGDGPWSPPGSGRTLLGNNAAPVISNVDTMPSFPENPSQVLDVGDAIMATDTDDDPVTYTFVESPDALSFDLITVGHSAQVRTKDSVTYDHEAQSSYTVEVKATDPQNASDSIELTITVTDVDEPPDAPAKPTVTTGPTPAESLTVTWTPPADNSGRPDITGYDLQYRGGTIQDWPVSPQMTGLTVTSTTITGLSPDTDYEVQVRAKNHEDDSTWSPSGSGRTAADSDNSNRPPAFGSPPFLSFPENAGAGYNIGAVTATDDDDDMLTYALEGAEASFFTIVESTGQIQTTSVGYDHETKDRYRVIVKADDGNGGTAAITVTIHVADVSENGGGNGGGGGGGGNDADENTRDAEDEESGPNNFPVFTDVLVNRSFPENTPPGRPIGAPVTATDEDGDPLTYTLQGPDAGSLDIDASTGQLRTKAGVTYDYETRSFYTVTVRATDPSGDSIVILVSVSVTDVPEAPAFASSSTVRSFPENTRPGRAIGLPVTAADEDGDVLTYTLEGTDAASFDLGASTGQLRTKAGVTYDYETRSQYSVTVRATDPGGASATIQVTINVLDVPEGPAFADSSAARSFPENTPPGRAIGLPVTATDSDRDALTYTLEGTDAASFDLGASTGQLRTRAGVTYDYETRSQYSVTVRATDPGGASATIQVTINVLDVPEGPAFADSSAARSFPENTPPGRAIGLPVTATDSDRDALTYTLEGTDAASFDLGASTGQLRTKAGVTYDYETRSQYSVTVRATDPGGASATIQVTINVLDVPEGPAFADSSAARSFPENTPPGRAIGLPVTATDSDRDALTYTLEGTDAASFDLGASTGQLRTKAGVTYDYETRSQYSVTVRAMDPGGASAIIQVTINVLDVPEEPLFASLATERSFPENTPDRSGPSACR